MDITKLSRNELIELQVQIKNRLKEFKPFRIREVYRRCGVEDCYCMDGPSNNEWGNLHGPYLYVSWRAEGKTKTISLGRKYTQDEIAKISTKTRPDWQDYYTVSPKEYYQLSEDKRRELWSITLSDSQFEAFHGLPRHEDTMDRYTKFYGSQAQHDRYWGEWNEIEDNQKLASSEWTRFGVGTSKGVKILNGLIRDGYYLKD